MVSTNILANKLHDDNFTIDSYSVDASGKYMYVKVSHASLGAITIARLKHHEIFSTVEVVNLF